MTKKALCIADLHLRPAFFDINVSVFSEIERIIDEQKPEYLFILGDVFHTKNTIYASMLSLFRSFLNRITKKCQVIVLVGNHDWGIPYSVHAMQTIKMENLTIVDSTFKLNDKIGFIAYFREQTKFEEEMAALSGCEFLFGHFDINGFQLGSGWEEVDSFCDIERFVPFKKVFSGHFHKAQETTLSNGTEIIYIGSQYTTDFNETDQEKRFVLLDLETGKWESIPSPFTLHKTIKISATDALPEIKTGDGPYPISYRIIVSGTKEQIASFIVPSGYPAKIVYEMLSNEASRLDINASDNQDQMMNKYVDYEIKRIYGSADTSEMNKDELMKLGRSILLKCKGK